MKQLILPFFWCFPFLLFGQTIDSTVIKQVDSLLALTSTALKQREFDKALETNALAEKIVMKKIGKESTSYGHYCMSMGKIMHAKGESEQAEQWFLTGLSMLEQLLGKEHPNYWNNLDKLSEFYFNTNQYEKSKQALQEVKVIIEKTKGKENPQYVFNLKNLAIQHARLGQFEEAESLSLEAISIIENTLGKENPNYTDILNNLALVYANTGQFEKAEKIHLEVKTIRENTLGKEDPKYASTINNLAIVYFYMGQYEKAEPFYLEAKNIMEKKEGKQNANYAGYMVNLGGLYFYMGQYEKAEPFYLEAKMIFEVFLKDREHPFYSNCLENLALLYNELAQYEKAIPLFIEAIDVRKKTLGLEHPSYAVGLLHLAALYKSIGQFEKTELLYLESRAVYEKTLGKEHPDYARCLIYLADLYTILGQFKKAEKYYPEIIANYEKTLGREHPEMAPVLNNLALLYYKLGHYEKAVPLQLEANSIWKIAFGMDENRYAEGIYNLANLYLELEQYEKAESLFLESRDIREKTFGKDHPNYAVSLSGLANQYLKLGQYEKAESLYQEVKAVFEKSYGVNHIRYNASLNLLANLYLLTGQFEIANPLLIESSVINHTLIKNAQQHLSEQEMNNYTNEFLDHQYQILSLAQMTGNAETISACYDNSLFYKGYLLNNSNQIKRLAFTDSTSAEKFNLLKGFRRRLATQYALSDAERDSALITNLETQANDIEKELTRSVSGYREAMQQVKWQEVQQQLNIGQAALEFVHYEFVGNEESDSTMYAALLLLHDSKQPIFIPLFEEKQLDSLLQTKGGRKADYVNNIYAVAGRGAKAIDKPQKTLYELIWQPLEQELADVQTIYYSPSGLLHRLNIGAIPITFKETLADRHRFVQLGSTRQIVIGSLERSENPKLASVPQSSDALLFGGIQYEMDSTAYTSAVIDVDAESITSRGAVNFNQSDSTLRGGSWGYLDWTEIEASAIEAILQEGGVNTTLLDGYKASEEAFKSIQQPSPHILHIATHGFFFPDPTQPTPSGVGNIGANESIFKMSDHPMIRSGLIMAGGNHAWETGKPFKPDMEDGVLTAYEISQMDLSNTELVVLSACETGLGDIEGNEGVYGLQRAFKISGAKYLIMSLWQVPDYQTQQLMTTFYKKWLTERKSIPDAFHSAQQEMRQLYRDPFFWAGFVLVE